MLSKTDKNIVAICGMNCTVCYKHLITKKYAKKCKGKEIAKELLKYAINDSKEKGFGFISIRTKCDT